MVNKWMLISCNLLTISKLSRAFTQMARVNIRGCGFAIINCWSVSILSDANADLKIGKTRCRYLAPSSTASAN